MHFLELRNTAVIENTLILFDSARFVVFASARIASRQRRARPRAGAPAGFPVRAGGEALRSLGSVQLLAAHARGGPPGRHPSPRRQGKAAMRSPSSCSRQQHQLRSSRISRIRAVAPLVLRSQPCGGKNPCSDGVLQIRRSNRAAAASAATKASCCTRSPVS